MAYRQTPAAEARLLDNRARILAAARALVGEGGWAKAQVARVAAAAGVATGTVYRYFPSKAELFAEVLADVSKREVDVLAQIARSVETPGARLHCAVATFVRRALRNPRLAYALIAEPCDREIDAERLKYRAAIGEVVRAIVAAGQHDGDMRDDLRPEVAATVIVGGFMESLVRPLSPSPGRRPEEVEARKRDAAALADEIARLACACVAGPPASRVRKLNRKAS